MSDQGHIYRVSFKEPVNDKTDYFFGSLSAIYETFSAAQIGCRVSRLWNLKITPEKPYLGRKCTISKEPVKRKPQKNTNLKKNE